MYEADKDSVRTLDAANTIQADNSHEKMLAHQLAAAHKVTMDMIGSVVPHSRDATIQTRRLNAAVRYMTAFQQGLRRFASWE